MYTRSSYLVLAILVAFFSLAAAGGADAARPNASRSLLSYSPGGGELAPPSACPGQTATTLSAEEQVGVMLCMTNYARAARGLGALSTSHLLVRAAEQKSADIVGCGEFSHEACGRPFQYWIGRYGYLKGCWRAAENIAWGTGADGTVGAIFTAWLESPEHHANILGPYREIGIGLRVGGVEGYENAAVWTQDFGSHKC